MKQALFIFAIFLQTISFAQKDSIPIVNKADSLYDPFLNLVFDKVVAFNFDYDTATNQKKHTYKEFGMNLKNFNYYTIRKSTIRTVDSATIKDLIKIVSDTSTFGQQYADCFEPRLGFTFFSGANPVFTILICFECKLLESTIILPASRHAYYDIASYEWDYQKWEEIKSKPIYVRRYLKGFSDVGEKRLLDICARLNMRYCKD